MSQTHSAIALVGRSLWLPMVLGAAGCGLSIPGLSRPSLTYVPGPAQPQTPPAAAPASPAPGQPLRPRAAGEPSYEQEEAVNQQVAAHVDQLLRAMQQAQRQQTSSPGSAPAATTTSAWTGDAGTWQTLPAIDAPDNTHSATPHAAAASARDAGSVRWLDVRTPSARVEPATYPTNGVTTTPAPAAAAAPVAAPASTADLALIAALQRQSGASERAQPQPRVTPVAQPTPATLRAATAVNAAGGQTAVLARLLDEIRSGNDPAQVKAMTLAALSLVNPDARPTAQEMEALTDEQRQAVRRFYEAALRSRLADTSGQDSAAMADHLDSLLGSQTLHIAKVRLCKNVSGFGVYDPFETTTFLAGREQPLIVYLELEHFRVVDQGDYQQVRLSQEVELYTDADGLRVWHQPAQQIVDNSHNRRRDFFTVQLLRLPQRLGVGKFRLKVRVTDQHGGSFDEVSVPIDLVAAFETAQAKMK